MKGPCHMRNLLYPTRKRLPLLKLALKLKLKVQGNAHTTRCSAHKAPLVFCRVGVHVTNPIQFADFDPLGARHVAHCDGAL